MAADLNILSPELEEMDTPQELKTLLSCSLCGRDYDLLRLLPEMLECKHAFCVDCTEGRLIRSQSIDCLICPICEKHSKVGPQPESLLFLLAQIPALKLGRAMLMNHAEEEPPSGGRQPFSSGRTSEIVSSGRRDGNSRPTTFIDEISVENFLMRSGSGHCSIHAMPHTIWCHNCQIILCRSCAELQYHTGHRLTRQLDFDELLRQLFSNELAKIDKIYEKTTHFATREMSIWHQLCETCSLVQFQIKREILEHKPTLIACQMRGWRQRTERDLVVGDAQLGTTQMLRLLSQLNEQKAKFQDQLNKIQFQCQLKALLYDNGLEILGFKKLNQRVLELSQPQSQTNDIHLGVEPPPALILTNYCIYSYWKELQSQFSRTTRMSRMNTELVPQYRQAVVQPNFNQRQREREAMRQMAQEQQYINRQLQRHPRYYTYWEDFNTDQILHSSGGSSNSGSPCASTTSSSTCTNPTSQLFGDNNYNRLNLVQQLPQHRGSIPYDALTSPYWGFFVEQAMRAVQDPNPQAEEDVPNSAPAVAAADGANVKATASANEDPTVPTIPSNPNSPAQRFPIYFLDMEIARNAAGRILIEVRNDVAPRMAENFHKLILHERGYGYRGCSIFQASSNKSITTGDFQFHNGRGGHAALMEDKFFTPDNTQLPPQRGAVGMTRGHGVYHNNSFVGSQFRLMLNEYCPFTAIFGRVISGIELVERIAATGDANGRPVVRTIIKNCGIYHQ